MLRVILWVHWLWSACQDAHTAAATSWAAAHHSITNDACVCGTGVLVTPRTACVASAGADISHPMLLKLHGHIAALNKRLNKEFVGCRHSASCNAAAAQLPLHASSQASTDAALEVFILPSTLVGISSSTGLQKAMPTPPTALRPSPRRHSQNGHPSPAGVAMQVVAQIARSDTETSGTSLHSAAHE